jgi:hypothetical protein
MALLDDVKTILNRLAPTWANVFSAHGLDITVPKPQLAAELQKLLQVDSTRAGFEELAFDARRAIEPGIPGRSLLYHALASADVHPPGASPGDYPTLDELDTIENYVYATAKRTLSDFQNPVVAVFAYQYREKSLSPHQRHADLCFSRCGLSRVGNEDVRYDPPSRSFDPRPAGGDRGFAATPARYAAFIAEYRAPSGDDQVLRAVPSDTQQLFLFPVHKLFAGSECLLGANGAGINLPAVSFHEFHINEKLRRLHLDTPDNPGHIPPMGIFNINAAPFVRDSTNTTFVKLRQVGASVIAEPPAAPIVATATQDVNGKQELARFVVPPTNDNRFWTSLSLPAPQGRAAPEYANIRQEVVAGGNLRDLNAVPDGGTPAASRFDAKIANGGYEAAHFVDHTADGLIRVDLPAPLSSLTVFPAFSLVAAIDYFPRVEQVEVTEWLEKREGVPVGLSNPKLVFPKGGPKPLSDGRFRSGLNSPRPRSNRVPNQGLVVPAGPAFPEDEAASKTVTAIVGRKASAGSSTRQAPSPLCVTWLPDAASDFFAPGWDVSEHFVASRFGGGTVATYTSYGLGSPFPEDAKLCAALNSFWPAVAPDSSRTFGFDPGALNGLPTSIPLTDGELGYNAAHPRVAAGEVSASLGWDGETGPFFQQGNVNAANPSRTDQTLQALRGKGGFSGLDQIDTPAFLARIEALLFARKHINGSAWLVAFEEITDWATWASAVSPRIGAPTGRGWLFEFARVTPSPTPVGDPALRLAFPVLRRIHVHVDTANGYFREGAGNVTPRPR